MSTNGERRTISAGENRLQTVMSWLAAILICLAGLIFFGRFLYLAFTKAAWLEIAEKHFAAIVGLPASAVASLFLVLVLRIANGPIEVQIGTVRFKGAAAPIVFWLLCFLAIAASIRMLWSSP